MIRFVPKDPSDKFYCDQMDKLFNNYLNEKKIAKAIYLASRPMIEGLHCPKYNPFLEPEKFERHCNWQKFFISKRPDAHLFQCVKLPR